MFNETNLIPLLPKNDLFAGRDQNINFESKLPLSHFPVYYKILGE